MGILEVEYSIREDFCHEILVASRCYDRFIKPSAYFEPARIPSRLNLASLFSLLPPLLLRNFNVIVEQRSRSFF